MNRPRLGNLAGADPSLTYAQQQEKAALAHVVYEQAVQVRMEEIRQAQAQALLGGEILEQEKQEAALRLARLQRKRDAWAARARGRR